MTSKYFKKYVNFIFVNEGEALHDRGKISVERPLLRPGIISSFWSTLSVDEIDSTLLAEQPALSVDEVEANSEIAKASFATFYSPSGRIYYLTPENTVGNVANFGNSSYCYTPSTPSTHAVIFIICLSRRRKG